MPALPETLTLLFTDIEGSTRLWEEHPDAMRRELIQHDDLLRACIESHGGRVFKTVGDAFCAVFADPRGAVEAVLTSQQWLPALALDTPDGPRPLKVRMALHTGVVDEREGDYFGQPLNRVARLLAIGHGGQVLLSAATQELVRDHLPGGATLQGLGEHRLKDLGRPETVFQLRHPELVADFPPLRSLDNPELKHNLPQQVTSFVGREKELAEVKALFAKTRLLTMTGAGGCGKTRLALQAAADLLDGSGDGVWLVELASLADPALVPQAVASVLGLREEPGRPLLQTLTDHLKGKHLLLLLDNCEHLLDGAPGALRAMADALLRQCPRVLLLATSREPLGIAGETTFRVPSLTLPDPGADTTPERLSPYESVRLFIERARQVQPGFQVTNRNAPALAAVCHRLDGIPLALELAAARVRSLTVEEVNQRLDQRFRLLTGGSRTTLPRHQTLRALIDWSYDLLNEAEQALLCRISVFAGGWTLEAAEQVCGGEPVEEWEILDLMTGLADRSMVTAEEREGATRYRLLETVRQYGQDRLGERGEEAIWRDRHLGHFLALAEAAEPELTGREQAAWLARLETEHDNLRAALAWSGETGGGPDSGARLAGALWRFWSVRGHYSEGREWLARVLAAGAGAAPTVRAKALNGAGNLARGQGDYAAARALFEESLAIRRELGDRRGIAVSLGNLGLVAQWQGDYAAARVLFDECLAIFRELGDRWGIAASLHDLGEVARFQGDCAAAQALYEESLAIRRELGDRGGIAASLNDLGVVARAQGDYTAARALCAESVAIFRELGARNAICPPLDELARVACDQGDYAEARALHEESLAIRRELGDRRGIAESLEGLAATAGKAGAPGRAARLWGAAERLREGLGTPLPPVERAEYEGHVTAARAALRDAAAFDAAWAEGRAMPLERAIELALDGSEA